jgi:hypothetical protein
MTASIERQEILQFKEAMIKVAALAVAAVEVAEQNGGLTPRHYD